MTPPDIGLTDADRRALADMAANGVRAYAKNGGGRADTEPTDATKVTCERCSRTWYYAGDRCRAQCSRCKKWNALAPDGRGLTAPMCAAIREAARDGLSYRQIADLFTFIGSGKAAHPHATGACSHDPGVAPVDRVYPAYGNVDGAECADLRHKYRSGASVTALHRRTGRSESTVYTHVSGACSHD